ncbi:3-hydroxyacyl-CoA dehydrogenase NAD-binding domain-containing protein [Niveispirillum sp. KHB5.9]|uniref:3-hydroxyacyl-CoA dehydrogenase NAD-binding domain-containing protein n=1 Tax=Niveispirillum sp. KHB5.9 TaxID=3400269 RepID=UPI003A8466B2
MGVVGAGAMGAGIAEVAAAAGHRVVVLDVGAAALDRGRSIVDASLAGRVKRGALAQTDADAIRARLSFTEDITDLGPCALVVEAIVEQTAAKASLFARLERVLAPDAIIASNTSSLPISGLATSLKRPERFVGLHFFNPAPVMKLVEVVTIRDNPAGLAPMLVDLMRRWGKVPVLAADVPGFIVNRVARPYYAEGFLALGEGLDAASIDHALKAAGGFRMGPLELADLIGHDVNYAVASSVYGAYAGRTRFRPQAAQKALVEAGHLGRKTGRGVFVTGEKPVVPLEPSAAAPARVCFGEGLVSLCANAAGDATLSANAILIDGILLRLGDGRTAASLAAEDGRTRIMLDMARDFTTAPTLVASLADPQDRAARAAFAGFAQSLGKGALLLPDRPGGLVLRTLAQLANCAADAAHERVADAAGIDAAMIHGANHPQGPLAWVAQAGAAHVRKVLRNLAEATGDALYLPSDGFNFADEDGEK